MLSIEEKQRYNRHLILSEIGEEGQLKIKSAKVLVIGAGGLGCPALQYLVGAGIGTIGIVDFDTIDLSNLQRQVLFTIDDIGKNKATVAAERLSQLNNHTVFKVYTDKLTTENALSIFEAYDFVLDGTDNFSTRYLVNDASIITKTPLVYGSIYKFEGQLSVFNYKDGPSYRCLFPNPPEPGTVQNCSEIGVLGILPGTIGTQMANEAIKLVLGIGTSLSGFLMLYNALETSYTKLSFNRSADQVEQVLANVENFKTQDYDLFCALKTALNEDEIDLTALSGYLNTKDYTIVDIREAWELPEFVGDNVIQVNMAALKEVKYRLDLNNTIVLICQTGFRSSQAKTYLENEIEGIEILHLKGGIEDYGK
ncbi:HesA/MoeB/ThiF family protein [Crocinitomix catalasitica]|uniref:HesA/MoeB/ThiF family protein n=1 Tax=Crocinitomix catalasitica TaxID=184607 RepID=UPI0005636A7A|nr:HesA/MoeB/ThiF family protein [Crocinitomix catalasitica]